MRQQISFVLVDCGRTLHFRIREMSAVHRERWPRRAPLLLPGAREAQDGGFSLARAADYLKNHARAALAALDYEQARPLLEEWLGCCRHVADGAERQVTAATADEYIEDVNTLFRLRTQALKLNLGFVLRRRPLDLPPLPCGDDGGCATKFANISGMMGTIIARRLATLRELQTWYSYEDALDMMEVIRVINHNEAAARRRNTQRR